MKLIKLHQIVNPQDENMIASELWVNKDIIRWAHVGCFVKNKKNRFVYTVLTLIADDKTLNILETPEEINKLCKFVQEVKLIQ